VIGVASTSGAVTVLFVAGMPRSGSTLFDLMVGQLPGHFEVGELFYLWQAGPLRDQRCACGEHFSACPFWRQVGQVAFGGWDQVDPTEFMRLQEQVDATARLGRYALRRFSPQHAAKVARYTSVVRRLYAAVAQVSGADIVVDSSKRPSTAALLRSTPGVDLRVALVVRDPRGVVNSWNREVPLPEATGPRSYLKRRPLRQIARRWMTVNLMFEVFAAQGTPTVRVRYEDLVRRPDEAMRAVLALVGRPTTARALSFLDGTTMTTGGSHAVAGGRIRMRTGPLHLRLDEAWRTELPRWRRAVTVLVCWPLMRKYGYLSG